MKKIIDKAQVIWYIIVVSQSSPITERSSFMKKMFTALFSLGMAATMIFNSSVFAQDRDVLASNVLSGKEGIVPHYGCVNGHFDTRLKCRKSRYYSEDYTHNSGKCTVIIYESGYVGFVCQECGHINSGNLDPNARHPCVEYHSSCGKGWTDTGFCRDGFPM